MPPSSKKENPLVSLIFNIALPSLILFKLSDEDRLGPVWSLVIGLAFPLCYGAFDFIKRKEFNFISALGFISILMTGGLGLLAVDGFWFAVKEASIPALIAVAVLVSQKMGKPLVRTLLFNDAVIDVEKVQQSLNEKNAQGDFENLLKSATWLLVGSFILSAVLNFLLAVWILKSPSGTAEFNKELGQMTALSYPVIALPCTVMMGFALWKLFSGIKKLTGLSLEEVFKGHGQKA